MVNPHLAMRAGVALAPNSLTSQVAGVGVNTAGYGTANERMARADAAIGPKVLPVLGAGVRQDGYRKQQRKAGQAGQEIQGVEMPVNVAPPRTAKTGMATNAIGSVGTVGNTAMQAEFMLPMLGWAFRNTIGQVSQKARQAVGAVTYAPFKALWNVPMKDVLTGNWKTMKGNYYRAVYDYSTGSPFGKKYPGWESMKQKAAALGVEEIKPLAKANGSFLNRLWNGRAYGVTLKVGLGAASVFLGLKAFNTIRHSISMMQELGQDVFGEQYSTWQILMNPKSMPPLMQEVRGNMVAHLMPDVAHAVGETGQNWAFSDGMAGFGGFATRADRMKQYAMIGGLIVTFGAQNIAPAQNFLQSYTMLKDTLKNGTKAPVELYAMLVDSASADARAIGGASSRLVQAIAAEYAKEQKSAVEVLKEIAEKEPYLERAKRAGDIVKAEDEAKKKFATPAHNKPLVKEKSPVVSHQSPVKEDKPGLTIAKEGLMHSGKVKAPQLGAEV